MFTLDITCHFIIMMSQSKAFRLINACLIALSFSQSEYELNPWIPLQELTPLLYEQQKNAFIRHKQTKMNPASCCEIYLQ